MKRKQFVPFILSLLLCVPAFAEPQDIDKELATLAEKLAATIKENGKKKVTVLDFTDLQGGSDGELGKYIAEQLMVNLVMSKQEFSVLDRANLKSILAEHKLTATGLVDPENAKKLGQFAGVDAMILGTIIPKNNSISLTTKIITTDTAVIVGAARAEFKLDEIVKQLTEKPATDTKGGGMGGITEKPAIVKTLGDLRAEFQSLRIINGGAYRLTMSLTNLNAKKSIWVAQSSNLGSELKGSITDDNGNVFGSDGRAVAGIVTTALQHGGFFRATEIKPREAVSATVTFYSRQNRKASAGANTVQLEFLVGYNFGGDFGDATAKGVLIKMDAE